MPARFDDVIPYSGEKAIAIGPLHTGDTINEICAWVYQSTADRANDAAATEMTTTDSGLAEFQQIAGNRWLLRLKKISTASFRDGRAFAVAVALMTDSEGKQRVTWWGQPVDLVENDAAARAAEAPGALETSPLNQPAELPTAA